MTYDPATVRAMLRQAYRRGHDDADEPAWNMHHNRCAEAGEAAINSILAARPAPSTPAPSELHEHCVRMAMEAYDSLHADDPEREERHARANEMRVRFGISAGPTERQRFLAAVRERIAQSAQVAACNLATNKDAAELLSAAEWLDTKGLGTLRVANVSRWDFGPRAYNRTSLALAILAAARSLGWGGR